MTFCRMTFAQMSFLIAKQASYKCPEDISSNGNSPNGILKLYFDTEQMF